MNADALRSDMGYEADVIRAQRWLLPRVGMARSAAWRDLVHGCAVIWALQHVGLEGLPPAEFSISLQSKNHLDETFLGRT